MMKLIINFLVYASLLALLQPGSVYGRTIKDSLGQSCVGKTYRVSISTNRTVFDAQALDQRNQSRTTDILLTGALHPERIGAVVRGVEAYKAEYAVYGTLCTPVKANEQPLQVLVHGIGFDSSYWDFHGPGVRKDAYSYVSAASKQGIPTFRFDRIGTGRSPRPVDGLNDVQAAVEAAVLQEIVNKAKTTQEIGNKKWNKVVVVGHSYGSILAHAVSRENPSLIDGLVLTGFSANSTATPYYVLASNFLLAKEHKPKQFGSASKNWLVTGTSVGRQIAFLHVSTVTPAALALFTKSEQPVSIGTFFTLSSLFKPAVEYTNPVQIVLGEEDFIFALQENSQEKALYTAKGLYPASRNATTLTPANTGHAINVHSIASQVYAQIFDFLAANRLS